MATRVPDNKSAKQRKSLCYLNCDGVGQGVFFYTDLSIGLQQCLQRLKGISHCALHCWLPRTCGLVGITFRWPFASHEGRTCVHDLLTITLSHVSRCQNTVLLKSYHKVVRCFGHAVFTNYNTTWSIWYFFCYLDLILHVAEHASLSSLDFACSFFPPEQSHFY